MLPVEAMVPPSGLQTFRKCLVVHTYIGSSVGLGISYRRKGGHVYLAAWDFNWTVFSSFLFFLLGLCLESKRFSPNLKLSQLSPILVLCSVMSWFFQQDLYYWIHPSPWCLIDARGKRVMFAVVLLMLGASELKSALHCARLLFWCLQERVKKYGH